MPLGTTYLPETVSYSSGDINQQFTLAQMNTTFGAGNVKTATSSFTISYNGVTLPFIKNVPHYCDAGLLALLSSTGAPVA